tara:strand:- start:44 stop:379 length:336 start_codon:yes stop_codon:yes gene_type:complete
MSRLIDTMDKSEIQGRLRYLGRCELNVRELELEIETLFANEPHWSDFLNPKDNQTWVLCFVSDDSPEETWETNWVINVFEEGYEVPRRNDCWKYATPVDLNVRYTEGGGDD